MNYYPLVTFHSSLKVSHSEILACAVRNKDAPRTVEITNIVPFKVGNVCAIIDNDSLETCNLSVWRFGFKGRGVEEKDRVTYRQLRSWSR